jgi:hypothetical protein
MSTMILHETISPKEENKARSRHSSKSMGSPAIKMLEGPWLPAVGVELLALLIKDHPILLLLDMDRLGKDMLLSLGGLSSNMLIGSRGLGFANRDMKGREVVVVVVLGVWVVLPALSLGWIGG